MNIDVFLTNPYNIVLPLIKGRQRGFPVIPHLDFGIIKLGLTHAAIAKCVISAE